MLPIKNDNSMFIDSFEKIGYTAPANYEDLSYAAREHLLEETTKIGNQLEHVNSSACSNPFSCSCQTNGSLSKDKSKLTVFALSILEKLVNVIQAYVPLGVAEKN